MDISVICRKLIFAQVLLGIIASCMAERSPGLLLVVGTIGAMSWYVTEGPSGRLLPRWVVNIGAILALSWLAGEVLSKQVSIVLAMGRFTIALQLLMLYMKKNDREYTQLLVLSLLQMISASVISISMIYGVLLSIYCLLALITVVVFHLTTAAERVKKENVSAAGIASRRIGPEAYAMFNIRRHFTVVVVVLGLFCSVIGATVFVVLPRTGKSGINITTANNVSLRQTGFSVTVQHGTGPIGTGSREPILNLAISSRGQTIGHADESWLLRGVALDEYSVRNQTWSRSAYAASQDRVVSVSSLGQAAKSSVEPQKTQYEADIALRDTRHRTIFSVISVPYRHGSSGLVLTGIESTNIAKVSYSPLDQQLISTEPIIGGSSYRLSWPIASVRTMGTHRYDSPALAELMESNKQKSKINRRRVRDSNTNEASVDSSRVPKNDALDYARVWTPERRRLRNLALSIIRDAGLDRDPAVRHSPDDLRIAATLSEYLQSRYTYDLVNPAVPKDQDPVVHFLFERRRGHCELFAAGLTALCRSIGIPARLVTGFRASEFNSIGGYYVVRQSNAHAWTEINAGPDMGWITFDATPAASVNAEHRAPEGVLSLLRSVYEHVEFAWIRQIVAFDNRTRQKVLRNSRVFILAARSRVYDAIDGTRERFEVLGRRVNFGGLEILGVGLSVAGLLVAAMILVRSYLVRRRRLVRLQLTRLPAEVRRDLGRRLGFYLAMLDILDRHGYRRPAWQSPQEFAESLAQEFPLRFDPVVALTDLFYDVRFGQRQTDAADRKRIRAHLKQLEYSAVQRRL